MKPLSDDAAIKKLVTELKKHAEICFDTETTGIDANRCGTGRFKFFC